MFRQKLRLFEEVNAEGEAGAAAPTPPEAETSPVDKWSEFLTDEDTNADEGSEETSETQPPATSPATEVKEGEASPPETPATPEGQEIKQAPEDQRPTLTTEQVTAARQKFEEALADRYRFSEDDTVLLQTEPEKVLPKMAARLQMDVLETIGKHLQQQVPMMIQEFTQQSARETQAQSQFFTAWPELRGYDQQIVQMGTAFRQMNPSATAEEAVERIGKMTMDALGLTKAVVASGQQQPTAPQPSFRPAVPGGVTPPAPSKNKWEQMLGDD